MGARSGVEEGRSGRAGGVCLVALPRAFVCCGALRACAARACQRAGKFGASSGASSATFSGAPWDRVRNAGCPAREGSAKLAPGSSLGGNGSKPLGGLGGVQPQASGGPIWSALRPVGVSSLEFGLVTGRVSAIALDPAKATGNHVFFGTTGVRALRSPFGVQLGPSALGTSALGTSALETSGGNGPVPPERTSAVFV